MLLVDTSWWRERQHVEVVVVHTDACLTLEMGLGVVMVYLLVVD